MAKMNLGGKELEVDDHGYLINFEDWDENVVKDLASQDGIDDLTEDHWKVINYLRAYYKKFRNAPLFKKLVENTGFDLRKIYDLFPSGPAKGACRVAGLPKPRGVV